MEHLPSRIEQLQIVLDEINPQIIVLTEHNMKQNEIERLNISNFDVTANFSRQHLNKGGVLILSNKEISWRKMEIPSLDSLLEERQFEFCMTKFVVGQIRFILVGIYRSPSTSVDIFLDRLEYLIERINKNNSQIIIAGDLNINVLVNNKDHTNLKHLLKRNNMYYTVNFPTRVFNNSVSALDNFLTNFRRDHIRIEGLITLLSDHDGQIFEILNGNESQHNKHISEIRHDFSKTNIESFQMSLEQETWKEVYFAPVEKSTMFLIPFLLNILMCHFLRKFLKLS